jgi:hypothetical protein
MAAISGERARAETPAGATLVGLPPRTGPLQTLEAPPMAFLMPAQKAAAADKMINDTFATLGYTAPPGTNSTRTPVRTVPIDPRTGNPAVNAINSAAPSSSYYPEEILALYENAARGGPIGGDRMPPTLYPGAMGIPMSGTTPGGLPIDNDIPLNLADYGIAPAVKPGARKSAPRASVPVAPKLTMKERNSEYARQAASTDSLVQDTFSKGAIDRYEAARDLAMQSSTTGYVTQKMINDAAKIIANSGIGGVVDTIFPGTITTPTTTTTVPAASPQYDRFGKVAFPNMPPYKPGVDPEWLYFRKNMAEGGLVGYAEGGPVGMDMGAIQSDPRSEIIAKAEDALENINEGQPQPDDEADLRAFVDAFGDNALRQLAQNVLGGMKMRPGRLVKGPGGPKDDAIPAVITDGAGRQRPAALSDGEYVVPADAVAGAGDGDPARGAEMLQQLSDRLSQRVS